MGFVIDASAEQPVSILDANNNQVSVTTPVRVYRREDLGETWVRVRILTSALAGTQWWVLRNKLKADGDPYVKTPEELANLNRAMSLEEFRDTNNVVRPVPFQNPAERCSERAELMALRLEGSGYKVKKIILIDHAFLRPYTIFGTDPPTLTDRAQVKWEYHIAPLVYADDAQPFVLDPSLLDGPATVAQWVTRMTAAQVEEMSFKVMVERLKTDGRWPKTPGDKPWLVTAEARVAGPPDLTDLDDVPGTDWDGIAFFLQGTADLVPVRRAAATLNILLDHWRAAVNADGAKRLAADPYPAYQTDLTRASTEFGQLELWAQERLIIEYPNLLDIVVGAFVGSGIEADIDDLFEIIGFDLTIIG